MKAVCVCVWSGSAAVYTHIMHTRKCASVCVQVAKACSHVMTQMPQSSINRNALCTGSLASSSSALLHENWESPLNFLKTQEVNFTFAGMPPVAQFAALAGSRWVNESLSILSIISIWYLSILSVVWVHSLSLSVTIHPSRVRDLCIIQRS